MSPISPKHTQYDQRPSRGINHYPQQWSLLSEPDLYLHCVRQLEHPSPSFLLSLQTLFVLQSPEQVLPLAGNLSGPLSLTAHIDYNCSIWEYLHHPNRGWAPWNQEPCHQDLSSTCIGLSPRSLSWYLLIIWLMNLSLTGLPHEATLHSVMTCH